MSHKFPLLHFQSNQSYKKHKQGSFGTHDWKGLEMIIKEDWNGFERNGELDPVLLQCFMSLVLHWISKLDNSFKNAIEFGFMKIQRLKPSSLVSQSISN